MKVAIVGAGLIGRLIALKLIPDEHEITLLESDSFDHPHSAAAISAGLIAPLSESAHAPLEVVEMGFQGYRLWPEMLKNLEEIDPEHQQVTYQTYGTLAISFQEEQECLLHHRQKLVKALPDHSHDIQMLYNDEVTKLEPEMDRFETAIYLTKEANLCNSEFLQSSSRAIRKYASIVDYWALKGDGTELQSQYDWIIDCRGAGAVGRHTHADNPMHHLTAIRGEVIRVRTDKVKLLRPIRVIRQRFTIYIVPKPDNIFVVGATDIDKHGNHAVTVRSSLDLLSALYAIHPGFADAEIIAAIAGQRALYESNQPSITVFENILTLNGLNRQGWLAGPAMVENLMQKIV